MKIQKIFRLLESASDAEILQDRIILCMGEIQKIEESIRKDELELIKEIKNIFHKDPSLKEMHLFFNLIVKRHHDDPPYEDNLLNTICMQIAESIRVLYSQPEDKNNGFVNWGGSHYTISSSEIEKNFGIKSGELLEGLFDKFNKAMEPYDVSIKQISKAATEVAPLSIHLRILK